MLYLISQDELLEDQNARLDQEGQFASIKEPRRGGTRWRPKPSPPHPPVATFGPGLASFQKTQGFVEKGGGFEKKVADLRHKFWGNHGGFSQNLPILNNS
jgi:hypothetical protein